MTEIVVTATLAEKMRFAADTLRELNQRYGYTTETGSWAPAELDSEAETADAIDAEREQAIQAIAAIISRWSVSTVAHKAAIDLYDAGWRAS